MTGRAFCVFCPFLCWVLSHWFVGVFMYSGANPPSVAHVRNISLNCRLSLPSSESLLTDTSFHINVSQTYWSFFMLNILYHHKFFPTSSSGRDIHFYFLCKFFKVCFWHLSGSSIWSWFWRVWVRIQFFSFSSVDKQFFQLFLLHAVMLPLSDIRVS